MYIQGGIWAALSAKIALNGANSFFAFLFFVPLKDPPTDGPRYKQPRWQRGFQKGPNAFRPKLETRKNRLEWARF